MNEPVGQNKPEWALTDEEMRENAVRLAFDGDRAKFDEFCRVLEERIPESVATVLGGSSVMGHSHEGDQYDAEGPLPLIAEI